MQQLMEPVLVRLLDDRPTKRSCRIAVSV